MEMRKQLAVGSMWTAGSRAGISLMGLVSTIILARLLTPDDFGLVAVAGVIFAIVAAFTELSLAEALIQHANPQRKHFDSAFTLALLRGGVVASILAVLGLFFGFYGDPRIELILYALSATALVTGAKNPKIIEFRRRLSFRQELLIQLAEKFAGLIAAVMIAVIYQSFWAIVVGSIVSQLVTVVLSYVFIPYLPRISLHAWRSLLSFSGWVALGSGLRVANWQGDQLLVGAVLGTSTMGQYNVGGRLASLPVQESIAPLVQVLFPAFAKLQLNADKLLDGYLRAQRMLVLVAIPVGIGFALVAGPLMEFLLGPKWSSAALVVQVLSVIFAVQAIARPFVPMAMGLGRTRLIFIREAIDICVRYPLILIGLFSGGLVGLLIARCLTGAFRIVLDMTLARRLIGVSVLRQISSNWRVGIACAIMVLTLLGLRFVGINDPNVIDIAVLVLAGGLSYIGTTVILWLLLNRPAGPELEIYELFVIARAQILLRWRARSSPDQSA